MSAPGKSVTEQARQSALDAYEILDTLPEGEFDDIVRLAADLCDAPVAQIAFIDRDRLWMKSIVGIETREIPRADSLCSYAILRSGTMVVSDASQDPRFMDNPFVTGPLNLRFYAGAPITTSAGHTIGTLCVIDQKPRELTALQLRALETLRNQVLVQLDLRLCLRKEQRAAAAATRERDRFFDLSVDPMCVVDERGRYTRANVAFTKLLGLSLDEVLTHNYLDFVHPEDLEPTKLFARQIVDTLGSAQIELRVRNASGEWRTISWTVSCSPDENTFYGIARDITDQRSIELQLRQSQKMDAIGQLAGGIAHDFNNMLSVVMSLAGFIGEELPEGHTSHADVQDIMRAAEGAANLTRQLLLFSRKSLVEVKRPLDLDALVGDVDKMVRRLIGENITLTRKSGHMLWPIRVDRTQMEQVLINLIVNARDAMPKGGTLTIEAANVLLDEQYVRTHVGVKAGQYVMLAVTDTGHGMAGAIQARIFEPFFTTKEMGKGTGLGLATVFGIIKNVGGHIWVDSTVGAGTTFRVYIPRDRDKRTGAITALNVVDTRGSETIMLVEDDNYVRELARRGLKRLGYNVVEATSGEEAMTKFAEATYPIDLLITDVIMAGIPGPELVTRMHAQRPELKVLLMSGYTENTLDNARLVDGHVHFLEKPLSLKRLGRVVRDLLDA